MNQHVTKRMMKVNRILATLKKVYFDESVEDKGINVDVLISHVCIEFGAGKRYVKEIIDNLKLVKKIVVFGKMAYYVPSESELKEIELDKEEKELLNNSPVEI